MVLVRYCSLLSLTIGLATALQAADLGPSETTNPSPSPLAQAFALSDWTFQLATDEDADGLLGEHAQAAAQTSNKNRSLRDLVRLESGQTSFYGLFGIDAPTVSRNAGLPGVVGLGVERPLDRGLAVNFELFQNAADLGRNNRLLQNTKAALKLRLNF